MANFEALEKNLTAKGYLVTRFETAGEAADYLDGAIRGVSVGFGGSMSLLDMGLYERLGVHNRVFWHWKNDALADAAGTDVYLSSVNALAETGEIVNIDGTGNRLASTVFGHKKLYFVAGANKITPDYETALWRARNVAAPKNAQRLNRKTPCAAEADRCHDCKSAERICRALMVLWEKPGGVPEIEVVLVGEALGF